MSTFEFIPQRKKCLMCGSERLRKFRAQASDLTNPSYVSIIECKSCTFAWQYPWGHSEKESVQWFEVAYVNQSGYFNPNYKRDIAKLEFEFVTTLPVKNKSLLDVGAGAGIFAEVAAENNWTVTAVDPALDTSRIKNNPMIKKIRGTMEQIPDDELFSIVTLWDVIEHATDPIELISNSKRYIQEGGWIVIETCNYKSDDRICGGMNHWIYQSDHRWYFSPESIKSLLKEAGFSEFILSDKVLRPGWNGSVGYAGPSKSHLLKSIVRDPLHLPTHISKYSCLTSAKGWEMPGISIFAIAAKKPITAN